jgi:hypothetical protein
MNTVKQQHISTVTKSTYRSLSAQRLSERALWNSSVRVLVIRSLKQNQNSSWRVPAIRLWPYIYIQACFFFALD